MGEITKNVNDKDSHCLGFRYRYARSGFFNSWSVSQVPRSWKSQQNFYAQTSTRFSVSCSSFAKTILGVGAMMKVTYFDILLVHQFAGHSLQQYSTGSLCFIGLSPSLCKRHSFGLEHVHGTWNKVVQIHNCAIWIDVSRMLSLNMHTHSLCEV